MKGTKRLYIHTSLQSSSADIFWATANPLGWKQLLIITYREKVSVLGLETVSILKICIWRNMFRQDSKKCTQEFKKWIGSQKKDVAKHDDWWQTGGGRQTMFFQLCWTADMQNTIPTTKPSENALCLDSLCITEQNYLTTNPYTEIKLTGTCFLQQHELYMESCMWKPPCLFQKTHPPIHGASPRTHALLPNPPQQVRYMLTALIMRRLIYDLDIFDMWQPSTVSLI